MNPVHSISFKKYLPLIIFGIAMGFLEAIVVVYVRELYYPEGFAFPLKSLPAWLILVEIAREIATLLMLGSVAWISGKNFLRRLSVFLFLFGIWDIIYYVALKIFIDWPASLFTWDILFLIPITWVGPVLAPVICSVIMIGMTLTFDYLQTRKNLNKLKSIELLLMIFGAAFIYYTFTVDFGMIIINGKFLAHISSLSENPEFIKILTSWKPTRYNWLIFSFGMVFILSGLFLTIKRSLKGTKV